MDESDLAFLVLAHTDAVLLDRLLNALPPGSTKIVHIDRKSTDLAMFAPTAPNTRLVHNRVPVFWAGFSVVEATLSLIRLGLTATHAQRFILLSGQSYPLRSNLSIVEFFDRHREREFIGYFNIEQADQHYINKLETYFISEEIISGMLKIKHSRTVKIASRVSSFLAQRFRRKWRKQLRGLHPAFGSQWWALTRPCLKTILEISETQPEFQFFKLSFAPDEMYFHTMVANSRFHERAGGFQQFQGRGNWRLNELHLLNSKGSLHKTYSLDDWKEIAAADKLFLRKLSSGGSEELIQKIEAELRKDEV